VVSCYWLDSRSLVTGKGRSFSLSFSAYRCKMGVKNFPAKRYLGAEGGGGVFLGGNRAGAGGFFLMRGKFL